MIRALPHDDRASGVRWLWGDLGMVPSESISRAGGRVEVVTGCMFSGKSRYLLDRLRQAREQGLAVVVLKHASDDRYAAGEIVAHDGGRAEAIPLASAREILERAGGAEVVVIDEAQFFDADLPAVCRRLAATGRTVLVAGLDRDSWGEPFGPMPELAALADEVTRTRAVCARCGAPAEYTQRLAPVETVRMIGGAESYEPRCAACFEPPPAHLRR